MLKSGKRYISVFITFIICLTIMFNSFSVNNFAATVEQINNNDIFLKQNTSITCTLSSAAMMLRRTAICADYNDWSDITEDSISSEAWVEGVGLRWKFTANGISVDHGYFSALNKKEQLINLLTSYPQGIVVYNSGSLGQSHAVFLCDYDAENDIFYAADPANSVKKGRIPLSETTMAGVTQTEKIKYFDAYWYVTSPVVTYSQGEYSAEEIVDTGEYDPDVDISKFNDSMQEIGQYYVVSAASGAVMRHHPSGNAEVALEVSKNDLLYIECSGNNNFGAKWYKANNGYYIFNSNLTKFCDYSSHINKFNQTAVQSVGTYSAASAQDDSVAIRIDATEGNNIVGYIPNGTKIYVVENGFNAAGVQWLKTEDGYFLKASEMQFESSENNSDNYDFECIQLTGSYSAEPVEDVHFSGEGQLYKVTASALNVRKKPVDGEIIGLLKKGDNIIVSEIADDWCRIDYNGENAWVSLNYLVHLTVIDDSYAAIIVDKKSVYTGETILCSVEHDGDYNYKYTVYSADGSVINCSEEFISDKIYSFIPDNAGEYYFGVEIKAENDKIYSIYSANFDARTELKLGAVSCDISVPEIGQTITWEIETLSVSENAVYIYNLYHNGLVIDESQSSVSSYSYTADKPGEYYITVYLKDSSSSTDIVTSEKVQINNSTLMPELILGDLNFDGNVTASDARTALRYATSLEDLSESAILAADVNKDGNVTVSDARLILRVAAKLDNGF